MRWGGQNSGRTNLTMDDWMRDVEKRTMHEERRPQIRTASDLMGPGLASRAVLLLDWNDEVTLFNGFFYSEPGPARHSPDNSKFWMGYNVANEFGYGYQRVYEYRDEPDPLVVATYVRRFRTPPGLGRVFEAWVLIGSNPAGPLGQVPGGYLFLTANSAVNATGLITTVPTDVPGLACSVTLSATRRYLVTFDGMVYGTVANDRAQVGLFDGATLINYTQSAQLVSVTNGYGLHLEKVIIAPTTGAHTIKVALGRQSGTGVINLLGTPPATPFISIEDTGLA